MERSKTKPWRRLEMDRARAAIKRELSEISDRLRLRKHLTSKISEYERSSADNAEIYLFVYTFYALSYQTKGPLFHRDTVRKLESILLALLETQKLVPRGSALSFLYRDAYLLVSQLSWARGNLWRSLCQQQMAFQFVSLKSQENYDLQSLSSGIRAFRVAQSRLALEFFAAAETGPLNLANRFRARVQRIRLLRLANRLDEAKALIAHTREWSGLESSHLRELEWEAHLVDLRTSGDLRK